MYVVHVVGYMKLNLNFKNQHHIVGVLKDMMIIVSAELTKFLCSSQQLG